MEPTELRKEFFAHARVDPYTTALMKIWADAWVQGFEHAMREFVEQLRAAGEDRAALDTWDHWHEKSWPERREDAIRLLTEESRKAEAEMIVAMAAMGPAAMATERPFYRPSTGGREGS